MTSENTLVTGGATNKFLNLMQQLKVISIWWTNRDYIYLQVNVKVGIFGIPPRHNEEWYNMVNEGGAVVDRVKLYRIDHQSHNIGGQIIMSIAQQSV